MACEVAEWVGFFVDTILCYYCEGWILGWWLLGVIRLVWFFWSEVEAVWDVGW